MHGDGGDDTVLGDNGRITRPTDGQRPVPDVAMADTANASTYGSDKLFGDGGDDVLYGQLDDGVALGTGDELDGGAGARHPAGRPGGRHADSGHGHDLLAQE